MNYSKFKDVINKLYPLNRSLAGEDNFKSLTILKNYIYKNLKINFFLSGKKVFDWNIPNEWKVSNAFIKDKNGKDIIDFKKCNLHVPSYSSSIKKKLSGKELKLKIFIDPNQKKLIPYKTFYYKSDWGFCLSYFQLKKIKNSEIYQIEINSKKKKGKMHYGESNIKGKKKDTIVFSSYICHPSMINNELISPILLTELFNYLSSLDNLYYSYKLWLSPETIGSIAIIHKNFSFLKKNVKAGFIVTCMGGVGEHSYISSKYGNTYADKLLNFAISEFKNPKIHKYTERGSDERQFGSPNVNLPFVTITKTKFGDYPEYHTSGDNFKFLNKNAVLKSFNFLKRLIFIIESNQKYISNVYCEPHLEKYDLFDDYNNVRDILNVWTYCDSKNDIIDIVNKVGLNYDKVVSIVKILLSKKIIKEA